MTRLILFLLFVAPMTVHAEKGLSLSIGVFKFKAEDKSTPLYSNSPLINHVQIANKLNDKTDLALSFSNYGRYKNQGLLKTTKFDPQYGRYYSGIDLIEDYEKQSLVSLFLSRRINLPRLHFNYGLGPGIITVVRKKTIYFKSYDSDQILISEKTRTKELDNAIIASCGIGLKIVHSFEIEFNVQSVNNLSERSDYLTYSTDLTYLF